MQMVWVELTHTACAVQWASGGLEGGLGVGWVVTKGGIFYCSVIIRFTIIVSSIFAALNAVNGDEVFNVEDHGAVGDGITDDSPAFLKAWNQSCGANTGVPIMYVPQGKSFLLNPISFYGPCNNKGVIIQVMGEILAPSTPKTWDGIDPTLWISFSNVYGLSIRGSGTFNGRGSGWWNQSCRYHPGKA
ncbi:hypothetical protein Syun_011101 [Stephania yunnanensis]|uniref:Uncharacterized protein n=1 Tax=Stephania yunnanensis TaxID=152371 RepID=A0AAP0PI62_9MAGN